ncbi:hypothetical protein MKK63_04020 [Methylobacterium sp. J-088]|uniref:DUF6680 family protein n=1 Tax=Methylobacterium sp. J-088 TaxID=2836664 RepID=UPI001FB88775|nr:DUF6680 family protein [Methylobacterium sp. J-088]MCJ2061867.1 hypothetical protein [Methylobacterium sp. J-088]
MNSWNWSEYGALVQSGIAIALALIAPYFSWKLARRSQADDQKRQTKLSIFSALIENRNIWNSRESVKALNLIDVVFHDSQEIRTIWREYHGMITRSEFNDTPIGRTLRSQKLIELQASIARNLNYNIDQFDIERVYLPTCLDEEQEISIRERGIKLLRIRAESQDQTTIYSTPRKDQATKGDFSPDEIPAIDGAYLLHFTRQDGAAGNALIQLIDSSINGVDILGVKYSGSYTIQGGWIAINAILTVPPRVKTIFDTESSDQTTIPVSFELPLDFSTGQKIHQVVAYGLTLKIKLNKISAI